MSTIPPVQPAILAGPRKSKSLVRYCLLAITVLSLLFSVVFSTIGIIVLQRIESLMTQLQQAAVWFHVFAYIIFAIFCLLGIYACVQKSSSATSWFTSIVFGGILFSIGSGVFCLYLLFNTTSSQPWDVNSCLSVAFDQFTKELCLKTDLIKGLSIAMFIVVWLAQIVIIILGNVFLSSLQKEEMRAGGSLPKYDRDGDDWC